MRKNSPLLLFFLMLAGIIHAVEAKDIVGLWSLPKDKQGRTPIAEVFEKNGRYYAYAFAYQDKSVGTDIDVKNPDTALQKRPMSEVVFIYDLSFEGGSWKGGEIYNPDNGKYFHLTGKITAKGILEWRASVDKGGIFGKTIVWRPVEKTTEYDQFKPDRAKIEANIPKSRKI